MCEKVVISTPITEFGPVSNERYEKLCFLPMIEMDI